MSHYPGQYTFHVCVVTPEGKEFRSAFGVDTFVAVPLRPVDMCTHPASAVFDGVYIHSPRAARIRADREGLANEISKRITHAFLEAIEKQDTKNGYPQTVEG